MTTDPIEQARRAFERRERIVNTVMRGVDDAAIDKAIDASDAAFGVLTQAILRYHPDVVRLVEVARGSQRQHLVVEDCWYSCPKAVRENGESAYCGDSSRNVCECGADAWNAIVDAALVSFKEVQE